jgi:hypothetical protein
MAVALIVHGNYIDLAIIGGGNNHRACDEETDEGTPENKRIYFHNSPLPIARAPSLGEPYPSKLYADRKNTIMMPGETLPGYIFFTMKTGCL